MKPTKQEVVPVKTNLPAAMDAMDMKAMYGDLSGNDITVPRITVLQGLSPEVAEGMGRPGNLFAVGLNQELGKELEVIPIIRNQTRIRWQPLAQGGGILCRSLDSKIGQGDPGGSCADCGLKEWVDNKQPACDLYENVIVVLRNSEDAIPMAISGYKTKLKAMRDWNTLFMVELQKKRPLFMKSYIVKVIEKTNKANLKYFSFKVFPGNNNQVLPEADIRKAEGIFNTIKGRNLDIVPERTSEGQVEANTEL